MTSRALTAERPKDARPSGVALLVTVAMLALLAGCILKKPPNAAAIKTEALPSVGVPADWKAPGWSRSTMRA